MSYSKNLKIFIISRAPLNRVDVDRCVSQFLFIFRRKEKCVSSGMCTVINFYLFKFHAPVGHCVLTFSRDDKSLQWPSKKKPLAYLFIA